MAVTDSLVAVAKKELRVQLNNTLKTLSNEEMHRQSAIICKKVLSDEKYKKATNISVYLSMPKGEVDTGLIMTHLMKHVNSKRVFIPFFQTGSNGTDMRMVLIRDEIDWKSLPLNKWGIAQQELNDALSRDGPEKHGGLDVILCPGLGFTSDGKRLGRGKGYYDSFMTVHKMMYPKMHSIGLAFDEQVVDPIPVSSHDFILDKVYSASNCEKEPTASEKKQPTRSKLCEIL